jgi:hypothetical protein
MHSRPFCNRGIAEFRLPDDVGTVAVEKQIFCRTAAIYSKPASFRIGTRQQRTDPVASASQYTSP